MLWKIFCEERKYPGMWQRWFLNQCVGVGWHVKEGCPLRGPITNIELKSGWAKCRPRLLEMEVGDHIVVALKDHRVARIGQIVGKTIEDHEWTPLVPPSKTLPLGNIGRRILVRWDLTIGPDNRDLVVALPENSQFNRAELLPTISKVRSLNLAKLKAAMNESTNWVDMLGHFQYESALSGYIAAYPYRLEDGLLQHPSEKVREKVFEDRRRLDVLLIDREGRSVIVECKQHSPTKNDCKQLRHYLKKLKEETRTEVRGILVHGGSSKLRQDVAECAAMQPAIEVVRYRLDVDFSPCA